MHSAASAYGHEDARVAPDLLAWKREELTILAKNRPLSLPGLPRCTPSVEVIKERVFEWVSKPRAHPAVSMAPACTQQHAILRIRMLPGVNKTCFAYLACLTAVCVASCRPSPSYREFMGRSRDYYAKLAEVCDGVVARPTSGAAGERRIPGNDQFLPPLIRRLNPNYVLVKTNGVLIKVGEGRGSYGVSWYLASTGPQANLWQMETFAEGRREVVYSATRLPRW
jgi:hypothetical protein